MALNPPHEKEQLRAIDITLATAPKIQDDLKAKFGYGENIFFYNDLVEYRINNSALDIAEELDVKSLYGLTTDEVARSSVGYAFRGHHNEDFMPDYQFNGLLGKETNDMIVGIRHEITGRKTGRKTYELGEGIHAQTLEEKAELGRKGYAKSLANLTSEELSELGRIGALASAKAQGKHVWSLEEKLDIHNFREDSIGKGRYKTLPSLDYVRDKMNEKYDKDWSTSQVKKAYFQNKHLLSDEEE